MHAASAKYDDGDGDNGVGHLLTVTQPSPLLWQQLLTNLYL
jgi:hypothetical protein